MAVETIKKDDKVLAIIVRNNHVCEGVDFLTPDEYSQQVAYMHHPQGKVIAAHVHKQIQRNVVNTQEVLIIKKGKLRVDFYDESKAYLNSTVLAEGDVILLVSGGHGFKALEELEMVEVKQGPYCGENDKERFPSVDDSQVTIK